MYYEIYLDVVFLINFILDFIIVKLTGCISKRKSTLLRCMAAAFVSSCILCFIYMFFIEMLTKYYFIMMLIVNLISVIIAFCNRRSNVYEIIRVLVIYYAVSFLLGGIINMLCVGIAGEARLFTVPWWGVLLIGTICFLAVKPFVIYIDRRRENKNVYFDVEIDIDGKTVDLKGLMDTGNHLIEPLSGKPVQVAELSAVEDLLPEGFASAVKKYYESGIVEASLYLDRGIRMVPFHAVGTPEDKLLVAVLSDSMKIKNSGIEYTDMNVYIALYNDILAGDGAYRILLYSKELIRERG